jgi:hypothetical protein
MNQQKDGDPEIAGAAKSPDDAPEAKRCSAEPVDRSERRMTAEQQRRLRDLCQRSGSQFEERLTPQEAERRIAELERILR